MKNLLFLSSFLLVASWAFSQEIVTGRGKPASEPINYDNSNGQLDSLKQITLDPVFIYTPRTFTNKRDEKRYKKLVYHIKKVYPYAKRAGEVLKEEEAKMASMGKSERKNHMKKVEKRIEDEFGKDIRNLTFTQGRILLKLIDRQTGLTSYELVDNLRGTFRAWFYDGIAGLFGYDLKGEYDPKNNTEDKYIEEIVYLIEIGKL